MITNYIPEGQQNAITMNDLISLTGLTDREVRNAINKARREVVILNLQDGKGYFRPNDSEYNLTERWVMQEEHRLREHALALRAGRKALKNKS